METATHYTSSAVESLRDEHRRVRRDLRHAEIMTEVLPEERLSGQRRNRMQAIGVILDDCPCGRAVRAFSAHLEQERQSLRRRVH